MCFRNMLLFKSGNYIYVHICMYNNIYNYYTLNRLIILIYFVKPLVKCNVLNLMNGWHIH